MDKWCQYITALLTEQNIPKGAKVLDTACGTGDIAIALNKYGYYVDAIDLSSDMLIIAKEKTHNLGLKINYLKQDMRDIKSNTKYNVVTCINDGVNYLVDNVDIEKFFLSVYTVLNENGLFIFDISTKCKLMSMDGEMYAEEVDDMAYIWANTYNDNANCLTMDISFFTLIKDNQYEKSTEIHVQKGHSIEDIKSLLYKCGFELIGIYDELSMDEPFDDSQRVHFICKKI